MYGQDEQNAEGDKIRMVNENANKKMIRNEAGENKDNSKNSESKEITKIIENDKNTEINLKNDAEEKQNQREERISCLDNNKLDSEESRQNGKKMNQGYSSDRYESTKDCEYVI